MGDQVGVELLYSSVKTEVKTVGVPVELEAEVDEMWYGKPHPADEFWGPEKMLIRCSKESHHLAE